MCIYISIYTHTHIYISLFIIHVIISFLLQHRRVRARSAPTSPRHHSRPLLGDNEFDVRSRRADDAAEDRHPEHRAPTLVAISRPRDSDRRGSDSRREECASVPRAVVFLPIFSREKNKKREMSFLLFFFSFLSFFLPFFFS